MAWLLALNGALSGRRFLLDAPCLVGRSPYNHVVLDDTRISRQHAKISPESGGHVVYDLNSSNGTFVNDVQVTRERLSTNDVVRFGPFSFRFERDGESDQLGPYRPGRKRVEELTRRGFEPPAKIVNSLDASAALPALRGLSELEDADRKLRTLYSFMQSISATLDIGEITERIVKNLVDVYPTAEAAAVYLMDPATGKMEPRQVLRRDGRAGTAFTLPEQFHEEVVGKGRAVLSAPMSLAWEDEPASSRGGFSMHAPILSGAVAHGVLHVRAPQTATPFSQGDLDLLTGIAAQAALALQNARMHQESLKQQRFQQDLILAEQIQKSFLPSQLPDAPGIEFFTEYRPAYSVGGDFYDVFRLSNDEIAIFIGDVSGKGVAAALLMARVSSDLRAAALAERDPAHALARVNAAVLERSQHDTFVTAIYLTLDVRTRKVVLANAGHPHPLIRRADGSVQRIEGGASTAIGLFEGVEYEQVELVLERGEALILCTDGVLEATDAAGTQFGLERVEAAIAKRIASSQCEEIAENLLRALRAHVGAASQYDDVTLVVLGVGADAARRRRETERPEAPYSSRQYLRTDPDLTS